MGIPVVWEKNGVRDQLRAIFVATWNVYPEAAAKSDVREKTRAGVIRKAGGTPGQKETH